MVLRGLAGLLAVLSLLAPVAAAESSLDAIRARGSLRVGVKTDAPPFGSIEGGDRPVGFEIELAEVFARVLFDDEQRLELVPVTTATRFEVLAAGGVDLVVATITVTESRRAAMELSDGYFMSGSLVLVPTASPVRGLAELAGRRVAVVRSSVQEQDVATLQPRAILVPVGSAGEGAAAVKSGRADAFVYDDVVALGLAVRDPALRVTGPTLGARPYAIAARKGETGLIRWVNGWLAKLRREGSYGLLWRRYFGPFESHLVGG
jgi:ABC-type amino acid transport substrate-binding protein